MTGFWATLLSLSLNEKNEIEVTRKNLALHIGRSLLWFIIPYLLLLKKTVR